MIHKDTSTTVVKSSGATQSALSYKSRLDAIKKRLKLLGADRYDLRVPETGALPYVLHPGETILGIVFGRYKHPSNNLSGTEISGRGVAVATDSRIFLLDKKPMFIRIDETLYGAINGTGYSSTGIGGTVTVHAKIGDIRLRTFNRKCAKSFVEAVESKIFQATKEAV